MSNTNVTPRFRRMAAILLAAVMLLAAVAVLVFPAAADEAYTYTSYTQANTDKVP